MSASLQDIAGLDFRDDGSIVAISKLGEKALDSITNAINILVDPNGPEVNQLKAACTLIRMVKPSERVALLSKLSSNHIRALAISDDTEVRGAMNRALQVAGRDALRCQDFPRFLKTLSFCSLETGVSLMELFPPLTAEMVEGLHKDVVVEAVRLTVERIMRLPDPAAILTELDSLLSTADALGEVDLPRAVAMKCTIWPALNPKGVSDPVAGSILKELQYRALLPVLTPQLFKSIPVGLKDDEVARVVKEQEVVSQNFNTSLHHPPGAAPPIPEVKEFLDFLDAMDKGDLSKAARLGCGSTNKGFRTYAYDELSEPVIQKVKDERVYVLESEFPVSERIGSDPGQFQMLLENLGIASNGDPRSQMIKALPTLCDADHSFVLDFILIADQGKELVAQAVVDCLLKGHYSSAIVASLFTEVADRVDLKSVLLKEIGASELPASAVMKIVIDHLKGGLPHGAEAAARIYSLTEELKGTRESLRSQMRVLLPTLCDADHSIELDFVLRTGLGQRLVAQAVEDYIRHGELNAATVASLFKALAHRVDLRSAELFSIDPKWLLSSLRPTPSVHTLIKGLVNVGFDADQLTECTQLLHQWRSGWRLLLIPCQDESAYQHQFGFGIYSTLSIKAIEDAALDAERGGLRDRMDLPALRIPQTLNAMLNVSVADKPLLSDQDLVNVMRAVVSSESLAKSTLEWASDVSTDGVVQRRVYKAMAYVLMSLQHDLSPSRFVAGSSAHPAVAAVASTMMKTMPLNLKPAFRKEAWWNDLAAWAEIA
ncbi:hypothetical protein [Variovorax soli]|uniref:Uncharacterized protein n=1 Tax=Variovorax soli TaxID=376815 RepID=A0ABU1NHC2_9BURK|nr:hypothetical protein [Variovorax soli]MDR6537763.1 hypothetical protein [Variovorax soli]